MGAVVFCNIAWMKRYRGITEDDHPKNGGAFVKENNDAMESMNFLPYQDRCYGYVQQKGYKLCLERLDRTASKADVLDDVTVVWVATGDEGSRIVGWYENAEMYRICQEFEDGSCYYFVAKAVDAYLIPVKKREFSVPRASQEGKGRGMGQSNVWYADSDFARGCYIPKVLEYLKEMRQECRIAGSTIEERKKKTAITNKTDEELLDMAAEASDDGDILGALQIINQLLFLEKAPCGFVRLFRGDCLEEMRCYDEAIESYKEALAHFTEDELQSGLDVEAKEKLSRLYRLTGKNFLAWHMEKEIFSAYKGGKNNAGMVDSLLEMLSITCEEKDFERMKKLIVAFDDIGTKYRDYDVSYYRKLLNK